MTNLLIKLQRDENKEIFGNALSQSRLYFYLTIFTSNLMAFMVGVSVTWTSPVLPKLQSVNSTHNSLGYALTTEEASWIGSLYAMGGICGPLIAGQVVSRWGRRRCILFCVGIPFAAAYYAIAFSKVTWLFYLGRIIIGIAASSTYYVVPMYNAEISEVPIRGRVCASISSFETFGVVFSYVVGFYMPVSMYCVTLAVIATVATIMAYFVLPESPHYLITSDQYSEARQSLMKLRSCDTDGVKDEFELIIFVVEEAKQRKKITVREFLKSQSVRRAQLMIFGLVFFQMCSGIAPVNFYVHTIFKQSGSDIPAHFCAIIVGVTKFLTTFFTTSVVDKFGRKPLLYVSAAGMMISEFALGAFFYLKYAEFDVGKLFWLPILCLEGYIFSYVAGFGPLVWTMIAEIFPIEAKATGAALSCCFFWVMMTITSKSLILLCDPIGIVMCFWSFSLCCGLALIFIRIFVVETKGKNFHEIRELLEK